MRQLILLFLFFIAIGLIFQALRRAKASRNGKHDSTNLTANEALPTATGRYRVQEALRTVETTKSDKPPTKQTTDTEEPPLPDPFDK